MVVFFILIFKPASLIQTSCFTPYLHIDVEPINVCIHITHSVFYQNKNAKCILHIQIYINIHIYGKVFQKAHKFLFKTLYFSI